MTIKEQNGGIRVEGIPDIFVVRENLKTRGYFDPSYTLYTTKSPMGDVTFKTIWWPGAVDVTIKKKPFLVPEKAIFAKLRSEIEKNILSA